MKISEHRKNTEEILTEESLIRYFQNSQRITRKRLGIEVEFFAINQNTGKVINYNAPNGIRAILDYLAKAFGYERLMEGEYLIGLRRDETQISLEPGGQVELSTAPVKSISDVDKQILSFIKELHSVSDQFPDVIWIAYGMHPVSSEEDISWVPKERYRIMAEYFKTHGTLSSSMMKIIASNQITIDYCNEKDAMSIFRTALGITPIIAALFANSPFSGGQPNGYFSYRTHIWNNTDPDRTGILPKFICEGKTFADYVEYILDMPMLFIIRSGKWIKINDLTFREFMKKGYLENKPTFEDFELHITTAFPEVRIKRHIEIRGIDGQSPEFIPSVIAFWKGILYDKIVRDKAWDMISNISSLQYLELQKKLPKEGLRCELNGKPIFEWAKELVGLAKEGLISQEAEEEVDFIDLINKRLINVKKSPSEILLSKWHGEWMEDISKLIEYLKI